MRQIDTDVVEGDHGSIRYRDIISIEVKTRGKAGDNPGILTGSVERAWGDGGGGLGDVGHQGIEVHGIISGQGGWLMWSMTGRGIVELRLHVQYGVQGETLHKSVVDLDIGLVIIHAHAVQGSPEIPSLGSCSPRRLVELDGYDHFDIDHLAIADVTLQKKEIINDVDDSEGQSAGEQVPVDQRPDLIEGCVD